MADPLGALGRPKTKGGTAASAPARMWEQSRQAHRDCAEHHTQSEVVATQLLHDVSDEQSLQVRRDENSWALKYEFFVNELGLKNSKADL